ncbi:MAG: hypothetical protein A4S14_05865 [Proteobacteria bacterium SG_bin9]|nr:MAG: hypothetical protein A4S14_05865 [Proteobacteria bacterium SG_bin9]
MTRAKGSRNRDYELRKLELAQKLRARLAGAERPSYAELAAAACVTVPTLKHYFGDRDAVIRDVLAVHAPFGREHLERLAKPKGRFAQSVQAAADYIAEGLANTVVAELHAIGLSEGIGNDHVGPAYITEILEPAILALEALFQHHIQAGDMVKADTRVAALALISPLIVAHLHQKALGGNRSRPLDLKKYLKAHVAGFVRAYQAK